MRPSTRAHLFRGRRTSVGIALPDRRHCYIVGKTGTGNTTFLTSLITADIMAGRGLVVIDPHGNLIEELLTWIPTRGTDDVVLIDPADATSPNAFNPLSLQSIERSRTALSHGRSRTGSLQEDVWR